MADKVRPNLTPDPEGDLKFLEEQIQQKKDSQPVISELAKHIHSVWLRNQEDFKKVRQEMVKLLRRVKGEYDPRKLTAIKAFRGSEIYLREVEKKARAAVSWIEDIYRGDTDIPWTIEPTELVDLPDETMEQIKLQTQYEASALAERLAAAQVQLPPQKITILINEYYEELIDKERKRLKKIASERCDRAAKLIRDQNQEGNWDSTFQDFLYYFVRLKFGVIKGPILRNKPKQVWEYDPIEGPKMVVKDELVIDSYCVSPFNFYPSRGMKNAHDGDTIEIHELSKDALYRMIGVPGNSDIEIRAALAKLESGKLKPRWFVIDDEKAVKDVTQDVKDSRGASAYGATEGQVSGSEAKGKNELILAQEFYGTVSGRLLIQWGSTEALDPQRQYRVNCWRIENHVIKAVVNPDPLGRKPYHISSWAKNPEWVVGEGLIEFGGPIEDAMNAIARAAVNNVAIASGPLCEIDRDRVDMRSPLYPWRQIESTSDQMGNNNPAVNYYQPQMHVGELTQAYSFFGKLLDEMTVPAYAQGASQSGVTAGTATVFTQLLAAASRSIKAVVGNIDDDIFKPYIQMCYDYNMMYSEDRTIKGDARVVAKGVAGLQAKEQAAQRKVEFLQVMSNPYYQELLGQENTGAIIAQIAKSQDIKLPDIARLNGDVDLSVRLQALLDATAGVDPLQAQGQMARGGGAPTRPQGLNPDGSKAGVNNG